MSDSRRNILLDVLRGVAILFVVFGHAIQSTNDMNPCLPLQKIIMTFWMPLFFIISGYADGISHGGGGIMRKANRLLVPYVFWASIVYVIDVVVVDLPWSFSSYLRSIIHSQFWFLKSLFWVWIIVYFGRLSFRCTTAKHIALRIMLAALSVIVAIFVSVLLGGYGVAKYTVLYLFGLAIYFCLCHLNVNYSWRIGMMSVCSVAFLVEAWALFNVCNTVVQRLLDLSMAITGSGMACLIAFFIAQYKNSSLCRFTAYLGRTSLEMYAVHWCLLFNTNLLCLNSIARGCHNVYLIATLGAVVWGGISLFLIKIIQLLPGGCIVFAGFSFRHVSTTPTRKAL